MVGDVEQRITDFFSLLEPWTAEPLIVGLNPEQVNIFEILFVAPVFGSLQ